MYVDAALLSIYYRRGVGGRHSESANPTVARGSTQGWHHAAGTVHILFIVCTVQYRARTFKCLWGPGIDSEE